MRTGRAGDRALGLVRMAGLLVSLGGLVWLTLVLVTQGVAKAGNWASVLGAAAAIVGIVVTFGTSWQQQRSVVEQPARAAEEELRSAVREQWHREAEVRSLGDPDPMPVRWRLSDPAVMDHDEHIAPTPLVFSGRSDRIKGLIDQFRGLHRRRLVIVGDPGSGKTTLAVQLLLQLLESWQTGEPVPVLFSLASWDPHTQPRVQDWLADQLTQAYPNLRAFGSDAAQKLADRGRLLPVLDGLDEIPPDRRGEVIDRLNASLHSATGLIVTSRTAEYTETVRTCDVLTAAAVIEPEPLTPREAATYLNDRLPREPDESWQVVLTALRQDTARALAGVVASPLGLWLLRTVYIQGHRHPHPLIDPSHYPDTAAIQHHLLDELIPAVIRSRPPLYRGQDPLRPRRHHDPERVRRWLTAVALELRDAQTRDWRWWHLAPHTLTRGRIMLVGEMVFGLVFGLVGGLVFRLVSWLVFGSVGLVHVLIEFSLFILIGSILGQGAVDCDAPVHADFQLRGRTTAFGSSLGFGLTIGLCFGLLGMLLGGLVGTLGFGLVYGSIGLVFGLLDFAASPSIARRASSPTESQRGDRRLTILAACMLGLVGVMAAGLELALAFGLAGDRSVALATSLGSGLGILLVAGQQGGLGAMSCACWPGFAVASLWLGARRRLPFRLIRLLDDAYRLGLLRIVGPVYQFRHAALQDHLAPPAESRTAAPDHPHR